jgi:hypothetical protein
MWECIHHNPRSDVVHNLRTKISVFVDDLASLRSHGDFHFTILTRIDRRGLIILVTHIGLPSVGPFEIEDRGGVGLIKK